MMPILKLIGRERGFRLGVGLISSEPKPGRCDEDCGERISSELVEASGNSSEVFEFAEEPLDQVALPIEAGIDRALNLAVALGWDVGLAAMLLHHLDDGFGVVTAVGNKSLGWRQSVEQRGNGRLVGGLTGREHDP
jgi:hypothetical protein